MFRVTYDVVTEESASDGDTSESGYYSPGGWKCVAQYLGVTTARGYDDPAAWTLREVVSQFGRNGLEDGGRSFYSVDSEANYYTGEETSYAVHPPDGITSASYARVRRILAGR